MTKIKVTIRYLGSFSQLTGKREEVLEMVDGASREDLAGKLVARYGREMKKRLEDAETRPVLFAISNRTAPEWELHDGDEVIVTYPAGGG